MTTKGTHTLVFDSVSFSPFLFLFVVVVVMIMTEVNQLAMQHSTFHFTFSHSNTLSLFLFLMSNPTTLTPTRTLYRHSPEYHHHNNGKALFYRHYYKITLCVSSPFPDKQIPYTAQSTTNILRFWIFMLFYSLFLAQPLCHTYIPFLSFIAHRISCYYNTKNNPFLSFHSNPFILVDLNPSAYNRTGVGIHSNIKFYYEKKRGRKKKLGISLNVQYHMVDFFYRIIHLYPPSSRVVRRLFVTVDNGSLVAVASLPTLYGLAGRGGVISPLPLKGGVTLWRAIKINQTQNPIILVSISN